MAKGRGGAKKPGGAAPPARLAVEAVRAALPVNNPEMDDEADPQEDLLPVHDPRSTDPLNLAAIEVPTERSEKKDGTEEQETGGSGEITGMANLSLQGDSDRMELEQAGTGAEVEMEGGPTERSKKKDEVEVGLTGRSEKKVGEETMEVVEDVNALSGGATTDTFSPVYEDMQDIREEEKKAAQEAEQALEEFANDGFDGLEDDSEEKEEERSTTKPVWYIVAQPRAKFVVLAIVRPKRNWPIFLRADDELFEGEERPLFLGDNVLVGEYDRQNFTEQECLFAPGTYLLNYEACVTRVADVKLAATLDSIGVITEKDRKKPPRYVEVCAPELPCAMRAYSRHWSGELHEKDLNFGHVFNVRLSRASRPPEVLVHPAYILPATCPRKSGNEIKTNQPFLISGLRKSDVIYKFPFDRHTSWDQIEHGERAMAAGLSAQVAEVKAEQRQFTLVVEPHIERVISDNRIILAFIHQIETINELTRACRVWELDTQVNCTVTVGGRPCASGYVLRLEREASAVGYLMKVEVMLIAQGGDDMFSDWEALRDGMLEGAQLKPFLPTRALERRMELLASTGCSGMAQQDNEHGKLMRILLGQDVARTPAQLKWKHIEHEAVRRLQEDQRSTAEYVLDPLARLVFQQAGPGTGKTFATTSIAAALLARDPAARILFVAPANVAVVKIAEELEEALAVEQQDEPFIALFSGSGKVKYAEHIRRVAKHCLSAAVEAEDFLEKLTAEELKKVKVYQRAVQSNPRTAREALVAEILLEREQRRVFVTTLSFAEAVPELFSGVTAVVIDEAGQASYTQVLSLLASLPTVTKLVVTGDRFQLKVHLPSLPRAVRSGFGLDSVIYNLDRATGVDNTTLSVSYRSHPDIVQALNAGFYEPNGERLVPGRSADERGALTRLEGFPLPVAGCPIILIHQTGTSERDDTSMSSSNAEQTETAMRVLWRLWRAIAGTELQLRCISPYLTQTLDVEREVRVQSMEGVLVNTNDSTQGHENDISVYVSTCSRRSTGTPSRPFWAEPDRVNVGLSRARHGIVIIGDLVLLAEHAGWRDFLAVVLRKTVVVGPHYLDVLRDGNSGRSAGGVLLDLEGRSVRLEEYYEQSRGRRQDGPRENNRFRPYPPQGPGVRERVRAPMHRDEWPALGGSGASSSGGPPERIRDVASETSSSADHGGWTDVRRRHGAGGRRK